MEIKKFVNNIDGEGEEFLFVKEDDGHTMEVYSADKTMELEVKVDGDEIPAVWNIFVENYQERGFDKIKPEMEIKSESEWKDFVQAVNMARNKLYEVA